MNIPSKVFGDSFRHGFIKFLGIRSGIKKSTISLHAQSGDYDPVDLYLPNESKLGYLKNDGYGNLFFDDIGSDSNSEIKTQTFIASEGQESFTIINFTPGDILILLDDTFQDFELVGSSIITPPLQEGQVLKVIDLSLSSNIILPALTEGQIVKIYNLSGTGKRIQSIIAYEGQTIFEITKFNPVNIIVTIDNVVQSNYTIEDNGSRIQQFTAIEGINSFTITKFEMINYLILLDNNIQDFQVIGNVISTGYLHQGQVLKVINLI